MPIQKYFKGKGLDVMNDMEKRYGPEKAKRVFYATANSRNMTASGAGSQGSKVKKIRRIKKAKSLRGLQRKVGMPRGGEED